MTSAVVLLADATAFVSPTGSHRAAEQCTSVDFDILAMVRIYTDGRVRCGSRCPRLSTFRGAPTALNRPGRVLLAHDRKSVGQCGTDNRLAPLTARVSAAGHRERRGPRPALEDACSVVLTHRPANNIRGQAFAGNATLVK